MKEGDVVTVVVQEHVWYKDLGLVKEIKEGLIRIEIHGKLIWMPLSWVKQNEY